MKRLITIFLAFITINAWCCTNIIVGKKASIDGSVFCSYNNDGYGGYGSLDILPAADYPKGTKMALTRWTWQTPDTIMQAEHTYKVVNRINEHQVAICETTFDGRRELINPKGKINYPQLMELGLQRAKTAREAIKVMAQLIEEYGYNSSGETFSICDPNEAWIMEVIGKGPDTKGAIWAAVRIPDDCICIHANQSRIDKIDFKDKQNYMWSKDVVKFARQKGYFTGKDVDFSFCDTYSPIDFSGRRFCMGRVWSLMYKLGDKEKMLPYLKYITGESNEKLPLYIRPSRKISLSDVENGMRDHYEDTPLDLSNDYSWGMYASPYRPGSLIYKVDGKEYHHERCVGTAVSIFSLVNQLRSWLPDEIGGVEWYGADDATGVSYVPVYCSCERVPDCFDGTRSEGTPDKFSFKSAHWMCNWVSNMVYPRYNLMIGDLKFYRNQLDSTFQAKQPMIENEALKSTNPAKLLTSYTDKCAEKMMQHWMQLAQHLIVKYNDLHYPISEEFKRQAVRNAGDRFEVKQNTQTLHQDVMSK